MSLSTHLVALWVIGAAAVLIGLQIAYPDKRVLVLVAGLAFCAGTGTVLFAS